MTVRFFLVVQRFLLPGLGAAAAVVSAQAAAGDAAAVEARKAIDAAYADQGKLLANKNVSWMRQYLTKDWVMVDVKGTRYKRDAAEAQLRQTLNPMSGIRYTPQIEEFSYKANTATVTLFETITADLKDGAGKTHKFEMQYKDRDFWVNVGGKWMIKQTRQLEDQVTLDGQPTEL